MKKIRFTSILKKFAEQGEKTGWTFIEIPAELATQLKPGNKKSFRVKGKLDAVAIEQVALVPIGGGDFILAVNSQMRKQLGKKQGAEVKAELSVDERDLIIVADFVACLEDEPAALKHFQSLTKGHQNYFSKWIDSAKTEATRTKRIAMAVNALSKKMGYPEMIRDDKARREALG